MRIAFLGHSYHLTTRSTGFFLELLRQLGDVELFHDESWRTGAPGEWMNQFRAQDFDCVVVFQMPQLMARLDSRHPNLVFVPMLDNHYNEDYFWWQPEFGAGKVVCFSSTLDRELPALSPLRFFAHYAPPVAALPPIDRPDELRAFFWCRRPPIGLPLLRQLTGETVFDRFTLQRALDPGESTTTVLAPAPSTRELADVEPWLPDRESYLARLAEHTVYFAPRLYEGIGMGFLEAMALGLCVVAPDTPTHNEYLSHGATGLLYSPARPAPLDFSRHRSLGERAREGAATRRERWQASEADLLEFLHTPTERLDRQRTIVDFWQRPVLVPMSAARRSLPTLTVVVLPSAAGGNHDLTLASVAEQDYPALVSFVVDPASPSETDSANTAAQGNDYPAMVEKLGGVTSERVIFLHAGDRFVSPAALRQLLEPANDADDVVYGHFLASNARGGDELRLVADFGEVCSLLDADGFDLRWMRRAPCLPATVFRASQLREFGFDPELPVAADFDLYRRLSCAGARFHLVDAVVACCGRAGAWSRTLATCAPEWLRLAVRHGRSGAARRVIAGLGVVDRRDAWDQTLRGWADRARERNLQRFGTAPSRRASAFGDRALRAVIQASARVLAAVENLVAAIRFPASRTRPDSTAQETYLADFCDGVDFRRPGRPSFVARLAGISWPEPWGRWTDGPRVEIEFHRVLPRHVRVELETFAHGDVAGAPVEFAVGAAAERFTPAGGETFQSYVVDLETSGREVTLALTIPLPSSPQSDYGGERRRLGLALRRLSIVDRGIPNTSSN